MITVLCKASSCRTHSVHWRWVAFYRKGPLWFLIYPTDELRPLSHQSSSFSLHMRLLHCRHQGHMTNTSASMAQKCSQMWAEFHKSQQLIYAQVKCLSSGLHWLNIWHLNSELPQSRRIHHQEQINRVRFSLFYAICCSWAIAYKMFWG